MWDYVGYAMHYFKRNIGDYHKKAGKLSMLEHGAYTLLIDSCYDRERFPTREEAIDWCWARSKPEIDAVDFVLGKFFTLQDGHYIQDRIAEEIATYQENAETNARIAREREAKRREEKEAKARTVHEPYTNEHEPPPNHKPLTINQEPVTNNHKPINKVKEKTSSDKSDVVLINKNPVMDADYLVNAFAVEKQIALDWLAVRKHKKASPLSETAIKLLINESAKAGITPAQAIAQAAGSGWISFKASYCDSGMQPTKAAFAAGDDKW